MVKKKAKNRSAKKKNQKPTQAQENLNPALEIFPITTAPPGLLLQMLYRFPVNSLLQLRCLSKFWAALINNPTFIQKHLNFDSPINKQLICNCYHGDGRRRLIAFLSAKGPPIPLLDVDIHFSDRLNYPRKINFGDFSKKMVLAGSINGIVCLTHSEEMMGRFVALWNPAIRYWNPIPLPENRLWKYLSVGLGFDVAMNDFKIICIVPVTSTKVVGWSRVEIYSANRDSWDNVDEQRFIPFFPTVNVLNCKFIVKGVPYWVGREPEALGYNKVLGEISPCTGLFRKVVFPGHIKNESTSVHVLKLRDSVAALIQSPGEIPNKMVDVYVLNEKTANWTRLYSIGSLENDSMWPIQWLNTGEIVLETWTGGIDQYSNAVHHFYDPTTNRVFDNNEFKKLVPDWRESYNHVESLVSLKGMVQIAKERIHKKIDSRMDNNWSEYLSEEVEAELHC